MNKITYIEGDLLDFPAGINVAHHGCNTQGIFGAGIALQIAKRYPEAERIDKACHEAGTNKLGTISTADVDRNRKIVNLYQQTLNPDKYKRSLNFEALYNAMTAAREWLDSLGRQKGSFILGFPKGLGSGLAVGHVPGYCPYTWKIVEGMIEANFVKYGYKVIVVEYKSGK